MPSVHFCYPENSDFQSWEHDTLPRIKEEFYGCEVDRYYQWSDSPERADLIILLESNLFKTRKHVANIEKEPLLNRFPDRVFTYNYEDHPAGLIDGVYAQMPASRFDPRRHRSIPILFQHNELIYGFTDDEVKGHPPELLFSFRGSISHPIRRRMFAACERLGQAHSLKIIDRWYDHSADEKESFVYEILNSKFVLAPRGLAPYTNRVTEAMAAGRVPIILADDFQEFDDVAMEQCTIRIRESEVENLGGVMARYESQAQEMGRRGREIWQDKFSERKRLLNLLDQVVKLRELRDTTIDMNYYRRRWYSREFQRANGWTFGQRFVNKLKRAIRRRE